MKSILGVALYYYFIVFEFSGATKYNDEHKAFGLDIKGLIEKLINDIKTKIPDEFNFCDKNVMVPQFLNEYIAGSVDLSNISFSGLKDFNASIQYQPIIPIPKSYLITIERLHWNVDYKSDLTVCKTKYLTIFGEGRSTVTLKNLRIGGVISISLIPVTADVTVDVDWDGVTFEVTGLLDDDMFSMQIGEFVGTTVTNVSENLKKPLSFIFRSVVNFVLKVILHIHPPNKKIENIQVVSKRLLFYSDLPIMGSEARADHYIFLWPPGFDLFVLSGIAIQVPHLRAAFLRNRFEKYNSYKNSDI